MGNGLKISEMMFVSSIYRGFILFHLHIVKNVFSPRAAKVISVAKTVKIFGVVKIVVI